VIDELLAEGVKRHQAGRLTEAESYYRRLLSAQPDHADALHLLGILAYQRGQPATSAELINQAINLNEHNASYFCSLGNALQAMKRFAEALAGYDKALALNSGYALALYNRGNVLLEMNRFGEALASYEKALELKPDYVEALGNRGLALQMLERFEEALTSYDRALALNPGYVEALCNRGNTFQKLERFEQALASYDEVLALKPDFAQGLYNRGSALQGLMRFEEALASYDGALTLNPNWVEALCNRGNTLQKLERFEEALASYEKVLALKPGFADAFYNCGIVLQELNRLDEALASYGKALAIEPGSAVARLNRGNMLMRLGRLGEALASYEQALVLKPGYPEALHNRGNVLLELNRIDEALASYEQAPDYIDAFGGAIWCINRLCDWRRKESVAAEVNAHIRDRRSIISPFTFLGYSSDLALQQQCAVNFAAGRLPRVLRPLSGAAARRPGKVRIAYLSADFRSHAMAHLTAELFERHDRSRFEVIALSYGVDDGSNMRKRLTSAFDRFADVRGMSDKSAALMLHNLGADIAIDLMGHTRDSRPGILAYRPAPVQASYLGYPGTMGASFIDYIIADETVVPFEHQPFYTEKIVQLPGCYQVNDSRRIISDRTPTRREAGLPEDGFVFCCFNQNWKITSEVFDVWMRLLHALDGSVLWLLQDNEGAERNLRDAAKARGIDPARLVFAGRLPSGGHLARHRLANLFLDTLPYNAHSTASDALWAGLPVVTRIGEAFAGRVAASLLKAIGLPELVTQDLAAYEALAFRLASDAKLLETYRNRLGQNRLTHPLFDTDRFRRQLEEAYLKMLEISLKGEQPEHFKLGD
jgi:protein O-GlcNAc transferase